MSEVGGGTVRGNPKGPKRSVSSVGTPSPLRRSRVVFAELPPGDFFNLCDPRWLPEVSRDFRGELPWHSPRYDPLRERIAEIYVTEFDRAVGHYTALRDSLLSEGFRNPIVASAGRLTNRDPEEIPPGVEYRAVCEYVGGSRLMIAQEFPDAFPLVPAIVNDANGTIEGEVLECVGDVVAKFADAPRVCRFDRESGTVYLNRLPYSHLPDPNYRTAEQSVVRRGILRTIAREVEAWLETNDR